MTVGLVYLDWFTYEPPECFSVLFVLFLFRLCWFCDLTEMAFPNNGDGSFKHATSMFFPFDALFVYFPLGFHFFSFLLISYPLFSFLFFSFLFISFPFFSRLFLSCIFFSVHFFSLFTQFKFNICIRSFELMTNDTLHSFQKFPSRKQMTR